MTELRGMTWDHPRGFDPLVATADAYMAIHPDVRIRWERRSLQDFADYPIGRLADVYDLIVIDHPFVGAAAAEGSLIPLDQYLTEAQLADQAEHSVGKSNASYIYAGHQWALAIDAAAHVSAYRPDLLERCGAELPRTWDEVVALACRLHGGSQGQVAVPLIPVDTLMCFYTLCASAGEEPFSTETHVVSRAVGRYALDMLRTWHAVSLPESSSWNPPRMLDRMSRSDEIIYCPLLFGYSNYARPGFRPTLIRFTNIPSTGTGEPRGAILGGTGLAISARARHVQIACDYAAYVASADVQRGLYFDAGGQPGHRSAWIDPQTNATASRFFLDTLDTLDRAYLRPRYNGYMDLQDQAGHILHAFMQEDGEPNRVLQTLDDLYRSSRELK